MTEIKSYLLEKQFRQNPDSFWDTTVYLLAGEEVFLKEDLLNHVFKKLEIGNDIIERVDADVINGDDLITLLETTNFDDNRTIVVIDNAEKLSPATTTKMYKAWDEEGFPESTLPIFKINKLSNRKLWGLIKEEGMWTKFWTMFGDKVPKWTFDKMSAIGLKFERGTENVVSELCNLNLRQISKEIEKLVLMKQFLTPTLVKEYIKPNYVITKFDIELKVILRDLLSVPVMLERLEANENVPIKEIVYGLIRVARYALQAKSYLIKKTEFAILLQNLAYSAIPLLDCVDWNSISRKNDLLKSASAIINGLPTINKMEWTGKLVFEEADIEKKTPEKKKRGKKAINFKLENEELLKTLEKAKQKRQWETSELYNHNMWYKANVYTIIKAFYMASQYSMDELSRLLLDLSKTHHKIFYEGDLHMRDNLEIMLMSLILK